MNNEKPNQNDKLIMANLKISCYEGTATAETFENAIISIGLNQDIIIMLMKYYKDEFSIEELSDTLRGIKI